MTLKLTLTRTALHGETDRVAAQALLDDQNTRDYPGENAPVPQNKLEAACDLTAVYLNGNTRLELHVTEWDHVAMVQAETLDITIG